MRTGSMDVAVIIPAAGSGQRLGGGIPKALRPLAGRTMLDVALASVASHPAVVQVVLAVPAADLAGIAAALPGLDVQIRVVAGGASRQASVAAALAATPDTCGIILVHDAARPLVPPAVVARVIEAIASGAPAAVPGLPVVDTIKRVDEAGFVVETPPRHLLRAIQTPQAFRREVLLQAHAQAPDEHAATDDAALVERAGYRVRVVAGHPDAMKITTPEDLDRAERLLASRESR